MQLRQILTEELIKESTEFLYHFTNAKGFSGIIESGYIKGTNLYPALSNQKNKAEIATTRSKAFNRYLSPSIGFFKFIIETRFVNKKIKPLEEFVVAPIQSMSRILLVSQDDARKIVYELSNKMAKEEKETLRKITFGFKKISNEEDPIIKSIIKKTTNVLKRFGLKINVESPIFSRILRNLDKYNEGAYAREQEERIITDKLLLNPKFIYLELLPGATEEFLEYSKNISLTVKDIINKVGIIENEEWNKFKKVLTE